MSSVLLAVFNDYETAERIRVMLVRDGFPTDRVELTAPPGPGTRRPPAGRFAVRQMHPVLPHTAEQTWSDTISQNTDGST
jgi:hypothetical protein